MSAKGRPRLSEKDRRDWQINIAVNAAELEKIQTFAARTGTPPAVFVRDRAISNHRLVIVPPVNQAVLVRLRELKLMLVQASLRQSQAPSRSEVAEYFAAAAEIIDASIGHLSEVDDANR